MRRLTFIVGVVLALVGAFIIVSDHSRAQFMTLGVGAKQDGGFVASCSQSSTFLARTSGLDTAHKTAYDTLICGLVTDGVWTKLDALYIFATQNQTTALLNLVQNAYNPTLNGGVAFSADHGFTGDGTTGYLNTGFVPSAATSPNYVLNSASIGVYALTNRTSGQASSLFGASGTASVELVPWWTDDKTYEELNGATFPNQAATTVKGSWAFSRTGSTNFVVYLNGASIGTMTDVSTFVSSKFIAFCARSTVTTGAERFSTDQESAGWFGAGLTAGNLTDISSRLNAWMITFGINVY